MFLLLRVLVGRLPCFGPMGAPVRVWCVMQHLDRDPAATSAPSMLRFMLPPLSAGCLLLGNSVLRLGGLECCYGALTVLICYWKTSIVWCPVRQTSHPACVLNVGPHLLHEVYLCVVDSRGYS